jgi:hypothetical protein
MLFFAFFAFSNSSKAASRLHLSISYAWGLFRLGDVSDEKVRLNGGETRVVGRERGKVY